MKRSAAEARRVYGPRAINAYVISNCGSVSDLLEVYLLLKEAIHNVCKHAQATHVELRSELDGGRLTVEVIDDGVGIAPRPAANSAATHGLLGIREQAIAMGGTAVIGGGPNGVGTQVRVKVPAAK